MIIFLIAFYEPHKRMQTQKVERTI